MSRKLALSEAQVSMSSHSGNRSLSRVCHVNSVRPDGSAVIFRPCAKSSMRRPSAVAQNALETDPMWKSVCATDKALKCCQREDEQRTSGVTSSPSSVRYPHARNSGSSSLEMTATESPVMFSSANVFSMNAESCGVIALPRFRCTCTLGVPV